MVRPARGCASRSPRTLRAARCASRRKRQVLGPVLKLGFIPLGPIPAELRDQVLDLATDPDPAAAAERAAICARAGTFGAYGFPEAHAIEAESGPWWRFAPKPLTAIAGAAATAAVAAVAAVAILVVPQKPPPAGVPAGQPQLTGRPGRGRRPGQPGHAGRGGAGGEGDISRRDPRERLDGAHPKWRRPVPRGGRGPDPGRQPVRGGRHQEHPRRGGRGQPSGDPSGHPRLQPGHRDQEELGPHQPGGPPEHNGPQQPGGAPEHTPPSTTPPSTTPPSTTPPSSPPPSTSPTPSDAPSGTEPSIDATVGSLLSVGVQLGG